GLAAADLFIGVLWPGDYWLPVVNYPFEGAVSMDCGRRLADFCDQRLAAAASLSFASHSLGARLVLEAVKHLGRRARALCLTAGAINNDCLATEYGDATDNATAVALLASRADHVLRLAFPLGDVVADLLHDDHTPFESALGYSGPRLPAPPPVAAPWQIPDIAGYDHGDYLPTAGQATPAPDARCRAVAGFIARCFHGQPQPWP